VKEESMPGMVNLELKRVGYRGRALVDRREKVSADWKIENDVLHLTWRASYSQQQELDCPITPELREALLGPSKVE
jgi:hypothetical protein